MGVKAGYHEETYEQSDVDDIIHSLLLLVVSNLDFEFLYKVASRSWVIKNPPKPIKIVLRFGRLCRSLSDREESAGKPADYWDPWVKRQRAKRSQRQISASREDLLDQHPDKSPKAIGIRRLQRSGRVAFCQPAAWRRSCPSAYGPSLRHAKRYPT